MTHNECFTLTYMSRLKYVFTINLYDFKKARRVYTINHAANS